MKTGTVTLLFTDLVGSTELIQRLGDDAADRVRRRYFRLLRDSVQCCGGKEVKSLGDGLMVAFPSALDAASCAVAMQQSIHDHNSEHREAGLGLRVGLHAGEPVQEGDDFFGQPVVIAKRLCDGAAGGQIVASELVHDIVGGRGDFEWRELGWLALKGVAAPVSCREIAWSPAPPGLSRAPQPKPPHRRAGLADSKIRSTALSSPRLQAAAAAALTLLLVVAGVFAVGARLDEQAASGDGSTGELVWAEVDPATAELGGPGNQRINRLLSSDQALVAVGQDDSSGHPDAAVWTSKDGATWLRRASDALAEPGGQSMLGITAGGPGFVAVGYRGTGSSLDAAVWTSEDGTEWTPVEDEPGLHGSGNEVMNRVAQTTLGLIAVGYEGSGGDRDAAAWASDDGLTWHRAQVPEGPADHGWQEMRSVAAQGGSLVAVGEDGVEGDYDAAVWVSKNGSSWRRQARSPAVLGGPGEQLMTSLVAAGHGFVAVGWATVHSDLDAQVWTSEDGRSWSRLSYDEEVFGGDGDQLLWGLESSGGSLIAVGRDESGGGSDAAVWTSEDGIEWTRAPSDEGVFGGDRAQEMRFVATTGSRLVGAGWDASGRRQDAAIWWAELP